MSICLSRGHLWLCPAATSAARFPKRQQIKIGYPCPFVSAVVIRGLCPAAASTARFPKRQQIGTDA
ncbi:hypothetical protein [uncultured Chloroflexus sp.]|uniref:hypothetical protein n=1 Tax=uncultured Chloroflexus sp. TaxID=214040 RepID=UPI00260B0ED6|nr:hypothetical protein [uncultured Chloroflexus sp.]